MPDIDRDDQEFIDRVAKATRVISVDASGAPSTPASAERVTEYIRYADAGPTGVTAHGTHAIAAGKRSYSVAVSAASGTDSPTLDGVALVQGVILNFLAPPGDTLEAAELITSAGDDVSFISVT